ncbi:MAG: hypothetical protein M3Y71_10115 [Actinomycetota bacterium]|nr:hypothetical protein [Actinomycetota bacterium]
MPTTLRRIATISIGLVVAGSLTGCGDGSAATPAVASTTALGVPSPTSQHTPTAMPGATPSSPTAAPAVPQSVSLDATGWLAGFTVVVKKATIDPTANLITIGVTLTNTSQVDQQLSQNSKEISLEPGDGSGLLPIQSVTPDARVVAGTSATSTLTFPAPTGVALDKAALVLGKAANHQWLIPLQVGGSGSGEPPVTLTPPARLTTPGRIYFQITSAQLLPWSCSGTPSITAFIPSAKTTSVIALNGTVGAGSLVRHANALSKMSITAPDGTTAAVITPPLRAWLSDQSSPNELMCVPVPTGLPGRYILKITDDVPSSATATITVP